MVQRKAMREDSGTLLMIERDWISKNVMPRKPGVSKVLAMAPRSNNAGTAGGGGGAPGDPGRSNAPGSVPGSSAFNCSVFQRIVRQYRIRVRYRQTSVRVVRS